MAYFISSSSINITVSVFFFRGRLHFGSNGQAAPFPSALAVWGASSDVIKALYDALPNTWQHHPNIT